MPLDTSGWNATADMRPPPPDTITITGSVLMPSPGYHLRLERIGNGPASTLPTTYRTELHVEQLPGIWTQVLTWIQVSYSANDMAQNFIDAAVEHGGKEIGRFKIEKVH